jgi:hypothetical protein
VQPPREQGAHLALPQQTGALNQHQLPTQPVKPAVQSNHQCLSFVRHPRSQKRNPKTLNCHTCCRRHNPQESLFLPPPLTCMECPPHESFRIPQTSACLIKKPGRALPSIWTAGPQNSRSHHSLRISFKINQADSLEEIQSAKLVKGAGAVQAAVPEVRRKPPGSQVGQKVI